MTARRLFPLALWISILLLVAGCVPQSDIERAGGSDDDAGADLTAIPDEDLPEVPALELRVLSVDVQRSAGRVRAEISIAGGSGESLEVADTAEVEWSDGEMSDAIPVAGGEILLEARRTDSEGVLQPVAVHLRNVTRVLGMDPNAEITADKIVTEWGEFPILSIDSASRPPGWHLRFQAAGQRWVSGGRVMSDAGFREVEGEDVSFNSEFRPVRASLRFGPEFDDLEAMLPVPAHLQVREAIPEISVDL